ncbi:hypothetical protein IW140_001696 [Coemansia sp. RSA 1813]|nr:hypothetical protein EV178_001492 [Coemansia sp. RSA 1646]KAJ1772528.1 hypothetical protein LPJ74_001429 [Coemansia sp. RSA 1843]KAJ2214001.1 hypothetical protein EV179_003356 [Coemansia sp. RSA 487]KAJ2571242.1 hypothetical protein IW140_001696 [Coemansia sp. RSA 1813]
MSQESLDIVRQLVAIVARTFYKDEYVIALDYLNRHEIARSDVLHKYLHVMPREMCRIYGELEKHKLVKRVKRRDEQLDNSPYQRKTAQIYFYIDYKQFVDVVKWRMWMLREMVTEKIRKEQQNLGYDCPRCGRRYNSMDVLSLSDEMDGVFRCDYCGSELIDNMSSELSHKAQKELSDFMDQFKTIIDLLRKTDTITLPPPTPLSEVPVPNMNGENGDAGDGKGRLAMGKGLSVSRDTGLTSGDTVIAFASDLSAEEAARIREIELAKKLQQNALPPWHIWSTVSGVQMVPGQKITSEAQAMHTRYVERQSIRKNRWNKRERDRARAVVKEMELQLRAIADGKGGSKEIFEEQEDEKNERYYAEYYSRLAHRVGIEMPEDPRKNYQILLDQLAKDEELEKAEAEKHKLEMEKMEKERKEAAAAAAAAHGRDRNAGNSYRYRGKFNSHYHKYNRRNYRHGRKATHRLFGFVDAALDNAAGTGDTISDKKNDNDEERDGGDAEANGTAGNEHEDGGDSKVDRNATASGGYVSDAGADHEAEVPDPSVGGIYVLSQAKRRRLGLDGLESFELTDAVPDSIVLDVDSHIPNTDISVKGKPKPMSQVTPQDESDMTLDEYTEYWNAWHRTEAGVVGA